MDFTIKYNAMKLATQYALMKLGYSKEDTLALTEQDYDYGNQDLEETIIQILEDSKHMLEMVNLLGV